MPVPAFTGSEQTVVPQAHNQQGLRGDRRKMHVTTENSSTTRSQQACNCLVCSGIILDHSLCCVRTRANRLGLAVACLPLLPHRHAQKCDMPHTSPCFPPIPGAQHTSDMHSTLFFDHSSRTAEDQLEHTRARNTQSLKQYFFNHADCVPFLVSRTRNVQQPSLRERLLH